jgi:hydrogenase nickel incorporation protein HypA/HybF
MHELAATQELLKVALGAAQQAGAQRITAIDLVIGDLNGLDSDSVQFYADLLTRGTPAEGATLRFRHTHATLACLDCGLRAAAEIPLQPICPACASTRLQVSGGREWQIERIEVDDAD